MNEIWAIVFGLSVLLALAVLLQPVAKTLRLPHTVLLALVGVRIAWIISSLGLEAGHGSAVEPGALDPNMAGDGHEPVAAGGHEESGSHHGGPIWQQALLSLTSLNVTADVILFIFLPALVFESSLSLDLRKLRKELGAILFLAVFGVLISATIAGFSLQQFSGAAIVTCQGDSTHCCAVIGAIFGQNFVSACEKAGKFDGIFIGIGTTRSEKDVIEVAWRNFSNGRSRFGAS